MNKIRIVLINPEHPGNIGAVARAMKTMELSNLAIVSPRHFPHVDATARAAGADDILSNALITLSLNEALADSKIIFGTSARKRELALPVLSPDKAAQIIFSQAQSNFVSVLFGRESSGLTNEELELCNYQININTNPAFCSLNLASAVQLIAYEIHLAKIKLEKKQTITETNKDEAGFEELQLLYNHALQVLGDINYLKHKNPKRILARLRLLFNRAALQKHEVNILRGILKAVQRTLFT